MLTTLAVISFAITFWRSQDSTGGGSSGATDGSVWFDDEDQSGLWALFEDI